MNQPPTTSSFFAEFCYIGKDFIFPMKFFRAIFVLFLFFVSLPLAQAKEDFLAPTKISFSAKPGETFSYDLIYKSGMGGVYDLSTRVFEYDEKGNKNYIATTSPLVLYEETIFEFQPDEEKKIPITVTIPSDFPDQDVSMSHFLRRRTEEQQTFELGSLMFLRIGTVSTFSGEVTNTRLHLVKTDAPPSEVVPEQGHFHGVLFDFKNTTDRYFSVIPVIQVYDQEGTLVDTLENQSTLVFPEFVKTVNVFNFSDRDISVADTKVVLQVLAEDRTLLHEEALELNEQQMFMSQSRPVSPFQSFSIRKGILYNPIFQIAAIGIGLTLIAISFFMKKK